MDLEMDMDMDMDRDREQGQGRGKEKGEAQWQGPEKNGTRTEVVVAEGRDEVDVDVDEWEPGVPDKPMWQRSRLSAVEADGCQVSRPLRILHWPHSDCLRAQNDDVEESWHV